MKQFIIASLLFTSATISTAASFDCSKAGTAIEKTICNTPTLDKLDSDLGATYKEALRKDGSIKQDQQAWIKERNKCSNTNCLEEAYKTRIADLTQMIVRLDREAIAQDRGREQKQLGANSTTTAPALQSNINYRERSSCYGILDVYSGKGNQLTPSNQKWISNNPLPTARTISVLDKVKQCRSSDPRNSALHEKCAKQLPQQDFEIYEGRLSGQSKMLDALNSGDKMRVATLVLACSE